jgi:hypothetical protein
MSLLVVVFFHTPISLLNTCHIPFRRNSMSIFQKLQPSALSAACPAEAGPSAGPLGGEPDRFGGAPNCYSGSQFGPRLKLSGDLLIGPAPSPAAPDLPPNPPVFISSWGPPPKTISRLHPLPHTRPHLHGRRPLKLLLLVPLPNHTTPNLDRVDIG